MNYSIQYRSLTADIKTEVFKATIVLVLLLLAAVTTIYNWDRLYQALNVKGILLLGFSIGILCMMLSETVIRLIDLKKQMTMIKLNAMEDLKKQTKELYSKAFN